MGLFKKAKLIKDKNNDLNDYLDALISIKQKQLLIKSHAINHAIDLISKTIAKSEIIFYRKDKKDGKIKETLNEEYYTVNIRPNYNQDGTIFWYEVLKKYLGDDQEALVVSINKKLYLAESFTVTESILVPKIYQNVVIKDNNGNSIRLNKTFNSNEVIYLNSSSTKIKEELDNFYEELGSLIKVASSRYKLTNLIKFRLRFPGGQPALKDPDTQKEIAYDTYKEKLTKGLFDEEDAILLLSENFNLEKINFGESQSNKEWSELEKKWSDKVAMSFNIPLDIFYGNKTDKSTSTNDFFSFAILPHLQIFEDSLNSKLITKDDFLKGECIKINRFNMKHFDILDSASNMDKLFSNGYSHNEINRFVGLPKVDEEWADKHYITKNYEDAEKALKGGDDM